MSHLWSLCSMTFIARSEVALPMDALQDGIKVVDGRRWKNKEEEEGQDEDVAK